MFSLLIIGLFLALWIWSVYFHHNWNKNVNIKLYFSNEAIYAGEYTKLIEVVENRKKTPLSLLEVGFHTKKDLQFHNSDNTYVSDNTYKRDIFACLGNQKITRQIDVLGKKRGYYEINNIDVTTFSLLHDHRYTKEYDCDAKLYVYPARVKVNDILGLCERMLGDVQCAKHLYEDPFAFRSIRDYMIDDPMKTINWSASARTGKLMVNTFDSVITQKAFIFLDLEDSSILKHEHLIEYSISLAATLAWKLASKNMEIGIASNSNIQLPMAGGKKQLSKIERLLALYNDADFTKMTSMSDVIMQNNELNKEDDVIYIFISKNYSDENIETITKFLGDEKQGIWICPYTMGDSKEIEDLTKVKERYKGGNKRLIIREVVK